MFDLFFNVLLKYQNKYFLKQMEKLKEHSMNFFTYIGRSDAKHAAENDSVLDYYPVRIVLLLLFFVYSKAS